MRRKDTSGEAAAEVIKMIQAQAHTPSPRLSRLWVCAGCRSPIAQGRCYCETCAEIKAREWRAGWIREAIDSVPAVLRWARIGAAELAERVRDVSAVYQIEQAVRAPDTWPRVTILGPAGTGKSSLAAALFQAEIDDCLAARRSSPLHMGLVAKSRFVSCAKLALCRRDTGLGSVPKLLTVCNEAPLLVLDDLGQLGEGAGSPVHEVIQSRYDSALRTVVTTGLRPDQISNVYGDGFARRLFEHALVINFWEGQ